MIADDNISLVLLHAGLALHNADWNWHDVRSPFARIYCVTRGTAHVSLPQAGIDLLPGKLYLIPPFVTHTCHCDGHFEHYYIHLYEQSHTGSIFDGWQLPSSIEASDYLAGMAKRLCTMTPGLRLAASNPALYDNHDSLMATLRSRNTLPLHIRMETKAIMLTLLSAFIANGKPKPHTSERRIDRALRYIEAHIDAPIDLVRLADEACVSKDHFIRIFRKSTGETPAQYITRKKLEQAELWLVTTDMPVKNIATALGYEDTSYFVRLFRNKIGITPQKYRYR